MQTPTKYGGTRDSAQVTRDRLGQVDQTTETYLDYLTPEEIQVAKFGNRMASERPRAFAKLWRRE